MSVDYQKELDALEEIVRRIEYILGNRTTYPKHVEDIKERISKYREKIMEMMNTIDQVHGNLDNTESRTKDANNEIFKLRKIYERLRILLEGQFRNLTLIEGKKPGQALNQTRRSLEVSNMAFDISEEVRRVLQESAQQRSDIQNKVPGYETTNGKILDKLRKYEQDFGTLNDLVGWINRKLCGDNETVCGGCTPFGCDKCGGEDGCDGAMPLALKAVEKAKEAERALWNKERKSRGGWGGGGEQGNVEGGELTASFSCSIQAKLTLH